MSYILKFRRHPVSEEIKIFTLYENTSSKTLLLTAWITTGVFASSFCFRDIFSLKHIVVLYAYLVAYKRSMCGTVAAVTFNLVDQLWRVEFLR